MGAIVSVQARMGSKRLPGKVMLTLCDSRTIELVVNRGREANVGPSVVTIGDEPPNEILKEWCRRNGQAFVFGPEDDILSRHLLAAEEMDADVLVRVNGDCPFVPPEEIHRVYSEHGKNDRPYTTNRTPTIPDGVSVDVVDVDVLRSLKERGETHPVLPLRRKERDVTVTEPDGWSIFSGVELTLDTPSDYWLLCDAVEAVGTDPWSVAQWIDDVQSR